MSFCCSSRAFSSPRVLISLALWPRGVEIGPFFNRLSNGPSARTPAEDIVVWGVSSNGAQPQS